MLSLLILGAACSFAPDVDPSEAVVTITLPLEARVAGTEIELDELATLTGDPVQVAALGQLELGYAPAPGYSRLLRVDQVQRALARRAPEARVRFAGQRATRVRAQVETVAPERLEAAARDALARVLGERTARLEPLAPIQAVDVPATEGGARLRARVEGAGTATTTVALEVLVEDGIYRTVWTRWRAERWIDIPVLARDVAPGQVFRPEDFRQERRAIVGNAPNALAPEALVGTAASRGLTQGATVGPTDYRRAFAVRAGSNLVLIVKKGAIEARVPATALEAAALGSRLRVSPLASEQELDARLLSADLAVIELDD